MDRKRRDRSLLETGCHNLCWLLDDVLYLIAVLFQVDTCLRFFVQFVVVFVDSDSFHRNVKVG